MIRIILIFLAILTLYWINKKINKKYEYIRYILKTLIIILSILFLFILIQHFLGNSLFI